MARFEEVKIGSVVKMTSGGPLMAVVGKTFNNKGEAQAEVRWFSVSLESLSMVVPLNSVCLI